MASDDAGLRSVAAGPGVSPTGSPMPPPIDLGRTTLTTGPQAPSAARAALSRWLAPHVAARVLDDARLLVTELVCNSVQHAAAGADAPIHVSAERSGGMVRVDVSDAGRHARVAARPPCHDMQSGFGLNLVDAVALRWGVTHLPGTNVWFELPVEAPRRPQALL